MSNESEKITRKNRIDPQLAAAGWQVKPFNPQQSLTDYDGCAIEEFPTANGPADYALCVGGQILGIIEAKKLTLGPQNVLTQAERYARGVKNPFINFRGFRVPFLYATNGEIIWYHDIRHPLSRSYPISRFHTPAALVERFRSAFETSCQTLLETPNTHSRLRYYQREANAAVEQALADHKRYMLVAMATGTGKTFTMVNQIYRLMKAGVAKRILFLVDRRALAAQAVRALASFEAEPGLKFNKIYEVYHQHFAPEDFGEEEKFNPNVLPNSYLTNPTAGHVFVFVCTIQRLTINLFGRNAIFALGDEPIDEDAEKTDIPIHAFDLIVADECHRGYTAAELSVWRKTLDHFDAIKIGLTATPASHTTTYFKHIVYHYRYEQAVQDGFLVDYNVVRLKSNVRMKGIFLEEGEMVGVIDTETGAEQMDLLEDERQFDTSDIEKRVTAPDSNRKILQEIKKYTDAHLKETGRFPKTLIFAVNDLPQTSHADQLVALAREVFGRGESFVQKITGRVDRPLQKIREFRNRQTIGIVVTVDMLSTGVDIPDLEFIVFLRVVKSRILYEQMMGRGTRKGEHYPDKSHFVVFDCFDGTLIEFFRKATGITEYIPERHARTIQEIIEDIWNNRDRDFNIRCLVKRLQRIDKEMAGEARVQFTAFIPDGDLGKYASALPHSLHADFTATMKVLRNEHFQKLLVNYPRPQKIFIKAYETQDEVSSDWLIRDGLGQEYKPEDYLAAFIQFVQENREQLEAIRILMNRPRDWNPSVLIELKNKLKTAPHNFSVENLQKAHYRCYQKALVDIISMVKHAARETEPLYTAEERVDLAFQKMTAGKTFNADQQQWLERIREHLITNLSIDKEDFEALPIFSRAGGWARANRVFERQLAGLIQELNAAVAA